MKRHYIANPTRIVWNFEFAIEGYCPRQVLVYCTCQGFRVFPEYPHAPIFLKI
mgnify:CR=1 FL=1